MATATAAGAVARCRQRQRRLHAIASFLVVFSFIIAADSLSLNSRKYPSPIRGRYHNSRREYPHPRIGAHGAVQTPCSPLLRDLTTLRQSSPAIDDDTQRSPDSSGSKLFNCDLSVPTVLLAAFLNLLGFTMASPIQPALGKHFSLPLGASFGSLSSAYPLGMMVGVFLWPTLSDVVGRKIVMSLTLMGSGLGLVLQSWGIRKFWTLEQFLATRVLTGLFAGNSPISKAYLADKGSLAKKGDLAKFLAWKDAASTLAFIVGPALGGFLYTIFGGGDIIDNSKQISCVILCSAVASIFASVSLMLFMKNVPKDHITNEKNDGSHSKQSSTTITNEDDNVDTKDNVENKGSKTEIIACPLGTKLWTGVVSVACVSALYHAADSTFFAFFPPLLQNRLNFTTQAVGMAFTSFAVVSFFMSAFVSSRFMRAFGPVASCTMGLTAVATGLWTLGLAASLPSGINTGLTSAFILGAAGLYYAGVPIYSPSVPSMLLQCVPSNKRGAVMGFDGAINTLARVVSPLVIGEVHRVKGAGACFKVVGSCAYVAVLVALFRRWLVLRKLFGKSEIMSSHDLK